MTAPEPPAAAGFSSYLILDLWQAVGCPVRDFSGYVDRNGADETWAALLAAVRKPGRCWKPVDGEHCILAPHAPEHPCYGPRDVGSSEPLPLPVDEWAADFRRTLGDS